MDSTGRTERGFTLIELSIVLVIIGLIVGGVLVGQNLVAAAGVRAQITQIEKYNAAVNTFRGKYGALPGDMNASIAAQFGFGPRGQYPGEGDGNGIIEGIQSNAPGQNSGFYMVGGETAMFWVDLTKAGLIDASFNTATETTVPTFTLSIANLYFPQAKIAGNYVYVWSGGWQTMEATGTDSTNYFGIQGLSVYSGSPSSATNLTVQQAYAIDKKVDDGLPQRGNVMALVNSFTGVWAGTSDVSGPYTTTATPGSSTTCFDNGNVANATQQYSIEISNGNNVNCALSFKMQGG